MGSNAQMRTVKSQTSTGTYTAKCWESWELLGGVLGISPRGKLYPPVWFFFRETGLSTPFLWNKTHAWCPSSFHILSLLTKFPILIKFSGKRYYKIIQSEDVESLRNREGFVYVYTVKRHVGEILNFFWLVLGERCVYIKMLCWNQIIIEHTFLYYIFKCLQYEYLS